jgi:hypothetical protein
MSLANKLVSQLEKDNQMNVTTNNLDNTTTTYGFDPMNRAEIIGFYTVEYWSNRIQGFKATLEDGQIVAIGAN